MKFLRKRTEGMVSARVNEKAISPEQTIASIRRLRERNRRVSNMEHVDVLLAEYDALVKQVASAVTLMRGIEGERQGIVAERDKALADLHIASQALSTARAELQQICNVRNGRNHRK